MINYTLHYHVGTPSKSEVIFAQLFEASGDLEANEIRERMEKEVPFKYDFNTLCQTSYLAKHGLADSVQRVL